MFRTASTLPLPSTPPLPHPSSCVQVRARHTSDLPTSPDACGVRVAGHSIRHASVPPNHAQPALTHPSELWRAYHQKPPAIPQWGWYATARRMRGTNTIREYAADVDTFAAQAEIWAREGRVPSAVLWHETMPQHFERGENACGEGLPSSPDPAAHQVEELLALCGAERWGKGERQREACQANWRNEVASPLVERRGISVVPMAALGSRGDLHVGAGCNKTVDARDSLLCDCSHWCDGSEASLYIATAILNVVAAQVAALHLKDTSHVKQHEKMEKSTAS